MGPTSLVRVRRRKQVPVCAAQMQLDVNVAVWFVAYAVNPAADGDAALFHVQPEGQVYTVERITRPALAGSEPVQMVMSTADVEMQVSATT